MIFGEVVSAAGVVFWLVWVFPSFLLSLFLVTQFTQNIEFLAPYFCWYLNFQVNRDEVKGNYPLAYDELLTEAIIAVFPVMECFSVVVVWPGGWRLVWLQLLWYVSQIARIIIQIHDIQVFKQQRGSMSNDGLYLQFLLESLLYRLYDMYSSMVTVELVAWPYMYIMGLSMVYWLYMLIPYYVIGPCLKAPVWPLSRSGKKTSVYMDRALRHLLGRFDCLDLSRMTVRKTPPCVTGLCRKALVWQKKKKEWHNSMLVPFGIVLGEIFPCLSASFRSSRCNNSCIDSTLSYFGK